MFINQNPTPDVGQESSISSQVDNIRKVQGNRAENDTSITGEINHISNIQQSRAYSRSDNNSHSELNELAGIDAKIKAIQQQQL